MRDEDELTYKLTMSDDKKTFNLRVESTSPMETNDLVIALECYLTDIIKAERQYKECTNLH